MYWLSTIVEGGCDIARRSGEGNTRMDPNVAEVAKRIHALREDSGLTMQELAEATGVTVPEY